MKTEHGRGLTCHSPFSVLAQLKVNAVDMQKLHIDLSLGVNLSQRSSEAPHYSCGKQFFKPDISGSLTQKVDTVDRFHVQGICQQKCSSGIGKPHSPCKEGLCGHI